MLTIRQSDRSGDDIELDIMSDFELISDVEMAGEDLNIASIQDDEDHIALDN